MKIKLVDFGHRLGSEISTNESVEEKYELTPGFILEKTGIHERRYFSANEKPQQLAAELIREILERNKIEKPGALFGSSNPYGEYQIPAPTMESAQLARLRHVPVYHINYGCGGYLGAVDMIKRYLETTPDADVLLVLTDWPSSMVNEYSTAVLFSDAVHVSLWSNKESRAGLLLGTVYYENILENPYALNVQKGFWHMDGSSISAFVRRVPGLVAEKLEISLSDFHIVPHQPNAKLLETLEKDYAVPFYRKDAEDFGNTTCSAMFIALENFLKNNTVTKPILLLGFGDTESYGGIVLRNTQ